MLVKPTTFSFIPQGYHNDYLCLCHSGTDTCRPGVSFGPAIRNVFMIHYVTAGKGTYNVDNRQYHLGPGDAFLIRPDETIVYTADREDPWQYGFIAFSGQAAQTYLNRTGFANNYVLHIDDDRINELICDTTDMLSMYPNNPDLCGLSQLCKILLLFAEHYDNERTDKSMLIRPDVQKVLDFISYHYADPITVMDMSKLVALERSYFCRIFKSAMGVSPKEYLTKFRLDKARYFLTESTLPIGKISECVGFQSFSSFSRLFIAQYQQSPSQYRKTFLKEEADTPCLGSH